MSDIENLDEDGAVATVSDDEDREAAMAAGVDRNATYAGWSYLAFLFAVFLVLALLAYSCDGDSSGGNDETGATVPVATTVEDDAPAPAAATPVDLVFQVSGDTVTLTGSVPDSAARDQLVQQARGIYGDANVIDELTIDEATTMEGGTITVTGDAADGDDRPNQLLGASAAVGGMTPALDVNFADAELTPADIEFAVATDTVTLSGVVPDEASRTRLIGNAEELYGAANVDSAGLTVGNTTWDGGQIRVTGLVDPGDELATGLQDLLELDNAGVAVANTVEVDSSAEALGRLQERLRAELAAEPIQFASGSANISPESDEILQRVADAMNSVPDIPVEIVGHTDNQGSGALNQALSENRASAVLNRLVELGVESARLSSRGAGAAEPIASNDTDEGRQENRRIEFIFEGALAE